MTRASDGHRLGRVLAGLAITLSLAACGGGRGPLPGGDETPTAPDWDERGPITLVTGRDTAGVLQMILDQWNAQHADQRVTLVELSNSADEQRTAMVQNARARGADYGVLNLDVVWTAEFAANGYVEELPAERLDLTGFLAPTVDSATHEGKLYGVPVNSDGGLLFYRKDWLDAIGVPPPTTWDDMKQACKRIKTEIPEAGQAACYAGQYQKYEGLTVNTSEAISSAGGVIVDDKGAVAVDSPQAQRGLRGMADFFRDGTIPAGAITWKEEDGRAAFESGSLIFHRNWSYVYAHAARTDGVSKVAGRFGVAPLPGIGGPGVSALGGHNYAVSRYARNKGTALDFIAFMASAEIQKQVALTATMAPSRESVYADPEVQAKYPYFSVLKESITGAVPRPKAVRYGEVTLAIQDSAYAVIQRQKEAPAATAELQTRLESLVK